MKKYLVLALLACSYSQAHEPYIAPLSYLTANTQISMLSGYAEEALNAEYALKDVQKESLVHTYDSLHRIKRSDLQYSQEKVCLKLDNIAYYLFYYSVHTYNSS